MIRTILLTTAAFITCEAYAQEAGVEPQREGDIVVTGTRSQGRAALDSSAPIDVVSGKEILESGYPDLGDRKSVV